jgi:hypothetical protein
MPHALPRDGTFRFVVPAGTYEVLSSYRSQDRWVKVQAGGQRRHIWIVRGPDVRRQDGQQKSRDECGALVGRATDRAPAHDRPPE